MTGKRLYRSTTDRQIAGVAGGLAEYLGMDPTLIRLGFVLLTLLGGPGLLIYIIMWLVMPEGDSEDDYVYFDEETIEEEDYDLPNIATVTKTKNDDPFV
ncbi:MAG: hypothetical protein Kow0077_08590 [Anaerolineae bacterium]